MTGRIVAGAAALAIGTSLAATAQAADKPGTGLTGPFTHKNLTVWFVRGDARTAGATLVTLQEAMERKLVRVHETGNVRRLKIENLSDRKIFIQAGDILKGGRQDRVITSDLILPPRSGVVPIGAYCVERGRWARRGRESDKEFASAKTSLPSRKLKIALYGGKSRPARLGAAMPQTRGRHIVQRRRLPSAQGEVWRRVTELQKKLEKNVKADVRAKRSRTSLQLSLENKALKRNLDGFLKALTAAPAGSRIAGVVVVINGKVSSADVYAHPALFRKMWPKLLHAAATEAVAETPKAGFTPASKETVTAFLAQARTGGKVKLHRRGGVDIALRRNKKSIFSETRAGKDGWVHRSYVAY